MHLLDQALKEGNLEEAKRLFYKGEKLYALTLSECHENCRAWLRKKMMAAIEQMTDWKRVDLLMPFAWGKLKPPHSQIVHKEGIPPLNLAAQLGDIRLIKNTQQGNPIKVIQESLNYAVEAGQTEYIKTCLEQGYNNCNFDPYMDSPLTTAILLHQFKIADMLLKNGADINHMNKIKNTVLMMAVLNKDKLAYDYICKKNPDLTLRDVYGNTVMHYAYWYKSNDIFDELLAKEGAPDLKNCENIFGIKPADEYRALANIGQDKLVENMLAFMTLKLGHQFEDPLQINDGLCKGLSFLFTWYASQGKKDYFFETIALLASWDGSAEALKKDISNTKQGEFGGYRDLETLFTGWMNDATWFQQSSKLEIFKQNDRKSQLEIVTQKDSPLFEKIGDFGFLTLDEKGLREIVSYLMRLPANTNFSMGASMHGVSGWMNERAQINYYDPNIVYPLKPLNLADDLSQVIIDWKYIMTEKDYQAISIDLSLYRFITENSAKNMDDYTFFTKDELPKSKADSDAFIKKSHCNFSHLHLAVLFNSQKNIDDLLKHQFILDNINNVDTFNNTPLYYAIKSGRYETISKLIKAGAIFNGEEAGEFIQLFSMDCLIDLIEVLKYPIDAVNINGRNLISCALDTDQSEVIKYLLQHGASVTQHALIRKIVLHHSHLIPNLLENKEVVNLVDEDGNTIMHYLCKYGLIDALKLVLPYGPDASIPDNAGRTPLELIPKDDNNLYNEFLSEIAKANVKLNESDQTIIADYQLEPRR